MAQRSVSGGRWSSVIVCLHWTMAAALIAMLVGGVAMSRLSKHAEKTGDYSVSLFGLPLYDVYQLHKSAGMMFLVLAAVRLLVRAFVRAPLSTHQLPSHERLVASLVQTLLYGLMICLPFSGWIMAASSPLGVPTVIFGLFELPHPVSVSVEREAVFAAIHRACALAVVTLVSLHVLAALKHHLIDRDNVLRAMLPRIAPRKERRAVHHD